MSAGWWSDVPGLFESAFRNPQGRARTTRYRFGLGILELDCDDAGLNRRFGELYPEGEIAAAAADAGPKVRCSVRSLDEPALAAIRFDDPEELDPIRFCSTLFPDRNYVPGPAGPDGWRTLALRDEPARPLIAMKEHGAVADRARTWQPLVANLGLNRLLRLQRDVLFFHAGTACIGGQGLMLVGPKASGKTTLSLTLAARGHAFLGDEVAAVHVGDGRLLPFRRAAAIREGVRAQALERRLASGDFPSETFPDGSLRTLASVAELFPAAPSAGARLEHVFFLSGFRERPRALPFEFGREHVPLLTPLGSTLWGQPGGLRMLQLSRLLAGARCYHLEPGLPDATADLLESLCKEPLH
jgi:hypothetical protein